MGAHANYLAIDLGASGGRGVLGTFNGESLTIQEILRFPNPPMQLPTGLHWDAWHLLAQVKQSLTIAAASGAPLAGAEFPRNSTESAEALFGTEFRGAFTRSKIALRFLQSSADGSLANTTRIQARAPFDRDELRAWRMACAGL